MQSISRKVDQNVYEVNFQGVEMFNHLVEELKSKEIENLAETILNDRNKLRTLAQLYIGLQRNEFEIKFYFTDFSESICAKELHLYGLWLNDIYEEYIAEFTILQGRRVVGYMRVLLNNDESDSEFKEEVERKLEAYNNLIKRAIEIREFVDY